MVLEVELHCQTVMDLLFTFVYPIVVGYSKFTISMELVVYHLDLIRIQ